MKKRHKFKRIRKRILTAALSMVLCLNAGFMDVREAKAAEVVAAYGTAEFIASLAATVGVVIGIDHLVGYKDMSSSLVYEDFTAPNREQDVAEVENILKVWWEKYAQEYINNNSGSDPDPSPTPAISGTPEPGTTPTPEDVPMSYDELKADATAKGLLELTPATFFVLGKVMTDFWNKIFGINSVDTTGVDETTAGDIIEVAQGETYPYYTIKHYTSGRFLGIYFYPEGSFIDLSSGDEDNNYYKVYKTALRLYRYSDNELVLSSDKKYADLNASSDYSPSSPCYDTTNLPMFSSYEDGLLWHNSVLNVQNMTKDDILYTPDHADAYNNNTGLVVPSALPSTIRLPSLDELKELQQNTNADPENSPELLQEFINALKQNQGTDPDPGTDPNPGTGTDPSPGGDGELTDPEVTPSPDDENSKYLAPDLKDFFPFCIPFDIYDVFANFTAERKAPCITFHLKSEMFNFDHEVVIDLAAFDDVAALLRTLELILFVILLAVATRKLIGA